jgi:hypothetical protein
VQQYLEQLQNQRIGGKIVSIPKSLKANEIKMVESKQPKNYIQYEDQAEYPAVKRKKTQSVIPPSISTNPHEIFAIQEA